MIDADIKKANKELETVLHEAANVVARLDDLQIVSLMDFSDKACYDVFYIFDAVMRTRAINKIAPLSVAGKITQEYSRELCYKLSDNVDKAFTACCGLEPNRRD